MWSSRAIVISSSLAANLSVREETRKAERLRAGETKPRPVLRLLVLVLHNIQVIIVASSAGLIAATAGSRTAGLPGS
jgi:hypothetical protein